MTALDRRGLLRAACIGCAALGLAACTDGARADGASSDGASQAGGAASPASGAASAEDGVIVKLADIPVGGSVSARAPSGKRIVLARPTETTVVAFSSTCTHQGCTVEPDGKRYVCPCHDSVFDALTGKNLSGPARSPLPAFAVKISGTDVVEG